MRTCRTCSHIKTNGTKCGSPALRHQTLCYFHYQWDRRERRRVRLGGPVGTNKNTGIDFPILEGPESIMIALMEVQHALLDARIDRLTAHTLLYSLQLAMQLKISTFTGLSSRLQSVTTCPELESDLDLSRAQGLRPAKQVCSSCPNLDACTDPSSCTAPDFCRAEERSDEASLSLPHRSLSPSSRPERAAVARGAEGPAFPPMTTDRSLNSTTLNPCHPERSAKRGVEGPFVSSPEATTLKPESANVITKIEAAAPERKQKALRLRAIPPRSAQGDTRTATYEQESKISNPALKGGASRVPSLRDENHRELGCESRMAHRFLAPRASHLLYFDI
jgi:hypothetical protein